MLHKLLNLTRPFFFLDTETTGTDPQKDRIIELAFQQWGPEGFVKEYRTLIDPVIPIPLGASKIHNIYDLDIYRCQTCKFVIDDVAPDRCHCEMPQRVLPFSSIARIAAAKFSDCDFGGQSVRFDLEMLQAEMHRAGVEWSYRAARIIDSYKLEQIAIPRNLSALYKKYTGEDLDDAHGALTDTRAAAAVVTNQLEVHEQLPRDLDTLHEAQWTGWLDSEGKFRFDDDQYRIMFGKWKNTLLTEVPREYWQWISSDKTDFSPEIKKYARLFANRQFPKVKV